MSNETKKMSKWLIVIVVCLLGCGMLFSVNIHFQPPFGKGRSYSSRIKLDDGTELFILVAIEAGKQNGFLIVACDDKQEHKPGLGAGPFGELVKKDETVWTVFPQPDINEKSHVVPKNSVCYVCENGDVTTLLTLEDKVLVRKLIDMSLSNNNEERELAEHLFDTIIRYAYQKEFSAFGRQERQRNSPIALSGQ